MGFVFLLVIAYLFSKLISHHVYVTNVVGIVDGLAPML